MCALRSNQMFSEGRALRWATLRSLLVVSEAARRGQRKAETLVLAQARSTVEQGRLRLVVVADGRAYQTVPAATNCHGRMKVGVTFRSVEGAMIDGGVSVIWSRTTTARCSPSCPGG
jgi:hypothetical protein